MDDARNIIKPRRSCIRPIIMLCLILAFISSGTTHAQNSSQDNSLKSYKRPAKIREHIIEKHKKNNDWIDEDSVISDLRETPQGPKGRLSFRGILSSYSAKAGSGDPSTRARAIAHALLKDEAELFGVPDLNELRERRLFTFQGHGGEYTNIQYARFIGDWPLEHSEILIMIGPDESVRSVDASLVPVPSELYQATAGKTILEEEARHIVEKDARIKNANIKEFKINKIKLFAIPSRPYAVWKGDVRLSGGVLWKYEVDAFTGEIIDIRKLMLGERE